eukprot:jgi/Galph1/5722/GphlegSOOS_G4367.1
MEQDSRISNVYSRSDGTKFRRLALLGAKGVGKSSIIARFAEDAFSYSYLPTIEDSYLATCRVNNETYNLEILDTGGQDEYSYLGTQLTIGVDGYILVYSICNAASFGMIPVVYRLLMEALGTENIPKVLVGNQLDLADYREVSVEEGKELAAKWRCPFVECSAKTCQNISKVFTCIMTEVEAVHLQCFSTEVPSESRPTRFGYVCGTNGHVILSFFETDVIHGLECNTNNLSNPIEQMEPNSPSSRTSQSLSNQSTLSRTSSLGYFSCFPEQDSVNKESSAYQKSDYESHLSWTKHCLLIEGKKVPILSAEFHYWRIPDRSRWRTILETYRSLGFNCVRIYFHWGFHSPRQGVYIFEGNRDVHFLLDLCEELQLFVIAAPGPYICAETQCGGFPSWLVAKREIRIRHVAREFVKKWDQQFFEYCMEWYQHFIPILSLHERTQYSRGCVIALQIENELMQWLAFLRVGLDKELRSLAEYARELGCKSPIIHNDAMPDGSWTRSKRKRFWWSLGLVPSSHRSYRVDLYGMDLYVTWPPDNGDETEGSVFELDVKDILSVIRLSNGNGLKHERPFIPFRNASWKNHRFARAFDRLERTTDGFGGAAISGPVMVCEAQGGWYNQWGRRRTYDDMYIFFGDDHTSDVLVSLMAQGITIVNIYMFYGGTNYGSLGDTEVYTSYDYAASIREYGYITTKARKVCLVNLFFRTFACYGLTETQKVVSSSESIHCSAEDIIICTRFALSKSTQLYSRLCRPRFGFLRNFSSSVSHFTLAVDHVAVTCNLKPRQVMIVPCDIPLDEDVCLHISGIQVVVRMKHMDSDLWVLSLQEAGIGRLAFRSTVPLYIKWCSLDGSCYGTSDPYGEDDAADIRNAPYEELSFGAFRSGSLQDNTECASIKLRQEAIGPVYHLSIWKPCFVSLMSRTRNYNENDTENEASSSKTHLRLVGLSFNDAATVTTNFVEEKQKVWDIDSMTTSAVAWGGYQLFFDNENQLHMHSRHSDSSHVFLIREGDCPQPFQRTSSPLQQIIPYSFIYSVILEDIPIPDNFGIPLSDWQIASCAWKDIPWKKIDYATERNPLDHLYTHGHTFYRCCFHVKPNFFQKVLILKLNIRHVVVIWCNGKCVGSHITYSHHIVGPGAVNFWDVAYAGTVQYDLTPYLNRDRNDWGRDSIGGEQELILLVYSFGQGRQPFVVNDVRNPRGLLSASFKGMPVDQEEWYISGINVSELEDPFNTVGIPVEAKFLGLQDWKFNNPFHNESITTDEGGQANVNIQSEYRSLNIIQSSSNPGEEIKALNSQSVLVLSNNSYIFPTSANDGLCWLKAKFWLPQRWKEKEQWHIPLALCLSGNVHCFAWINHLQLARYVGQVGPQSVFYIPSGVIERNEVNQLVITYYTQDESATLGVRIVPFVIEEGTGNWIEEQLSDSSILPFATFYQSTAK